MFLLPCFFSYFYIFFCYLPLFRNWTADQDQNWAKNDPYLERIEAKCHWGLLSRFWGGANRVLKHWSWKVLKWDMGAEKVMKRTEFWFCHLNGNPDFTTFITAWRISSRGPRKSDVRLGFLAFCSGTGMWFLIRDIAIVSIIYWNCFS